MVPQALQDSAVYTSRGICLAEPAISDDVSELQASKIRKLPESFQCLNLVRCNVFKRRDSSENLVYTRTQRKQIIVEGDWRRRRSPRRVEASIVPAGVDRIVD